MMPTPYSYVNTVLDELLEQARDILGDEFIGMYLYGSLAGGDFDPRRSDIDFIVVTRGMLPQSKIDDLQQMHLKLADSGSKWARKLEGLYIPLHELRRHDAHGPQLPTINEGRFYLAGQGSDWVIQRHVLREQEMIVCGPSIREFIDPVTAREMRDEVSAIMRDWWAPMVADPTWLNGRPEYQAFAVQTMCRVLYTLEFGTAVSKTAAALWAVHALNDEWRDLIEEAIAWPAGQPSSLERTIDFIHYTVNCSTSRSQKNSSQSLSP